MRELIANWFTNEDSVGARLRKVGYSDVALAILAVTIISVMIIPLPLIVIDILVAISISTGVGLLLLSIYIPSAVAFSILSLRSVGPPLCASQSSSGIGCRSSS